MAQPPAAEGVVELPSALVIVGPSGVGKGTLINRLMEADKSYGFSCSHTTRPPREGEVNGVHYHFTSHEAMEAEIAAGKFLEHAHVHKNIYGTSIQAVQDVANAGRCCVLDIDVQGARQVRKAGLRAIFVFIAPPSLEELEHRLRGRATDSEEQITTRLRNAQEEVESVKEAGLYDCVIVNNNLEDAYRQLVAVAKRALAGEVGPSLGSPRGSPTAAAAAAAAGGAGAASADAEPGSGSTAGRASSSSSGVVQQRRTSSGAAALNSTATFKAWLPGEGQSQLNSPQTDEAALLPGAVAASAAGYGWERQHGRVAVVTGAGSGVGWELATSLALAGMRVVAVSRRKAQLEKLQQAMLDAGLAQEDFLPVVADLTKEAEVSALPRIVAKRWPGAGIDVLINNAAVARTDGSLMSGSTEAWVDTVSTNVLGTALATREAVQSMEERQQWGHVINICCAEEGSGMHAATKQAVCSMAQELRLEARARGVPLRVSTITPTALNSYFFRTRAGRNKPRSRHEAADSPSGADATGAAAQEQPTGSLLHASDVVQACVWCLSAPDHVDVSDITVRSL